MAYPDPKIVTVAAPTKQVNPTRPPRAHPHVQRPASTPASSSSEAVNSLPPTGKAISVDVIDIVRVRDERFVEHWNVLDTLALMRQMGGIAPPPG